MANSNFVVHNGLTVGPLTIFAGNGDITTTGNVSSTGTNFVTVNEYVIGNEFVSGNMVGNSGTVSTSITTGALVLSGSGGAGIGGNVYIGGSAGNAIISTGDIYNQGNIWTTAATNTGLKTNQTTAYVYNETATTVRIGGAATTVSIGAAGADTLTYQATTGSLIPGANAAVNLGSTTAYWGTLFSGNIVSNAHVVGGSGIISSGSILPGANITQNLGSSTAFYGTAFAGQFTGNGATIGATGVTSTGNIAINTATNSGLTTNQTTAYVFNETATTVRVAGAGVVQFNNNTQATSTSTGAIQLKGGMSINTGNVYIGGSGGNAIISTGELYNNGNIFLTGQGLTALRTNQTTVYLFPDTASTIVLGSHPSGTAVTQLKSNSQATSTTTGAIQLTGGMSINTGNLFIGGSAGNAIIVTGNIIPSSNLATTNNLGSDTAWWNNFYGVSTQARYADLAENYQGDAAYEPGTVVEFGGTAEVTVTMTAESLRVAGVVSTNPAHLMNGALKGSNVLPIALMGRVPCKVIGPVYKGDMMVSAGYGYARAKANPQLGSVIGKALQDFNGDKGVIEVVVGRM